MQEHGHGKARYQRYPEGRCREQGLLWYVTSTALLTLDIERSKHSGVQSAFSQHLVKPGHVEPEYSKMYARARRLREDYDYADELRDLDERITADLLADAERFVARMDRYLRKAGAME